MKVAHMQFDRMIGKTRVVNAGSVGMPFEDAGAFWALLGSDVQLRCTHITISCGPRSAFEQRIIHRPKSLQPVVSVLQPPSESEMLELFSSAELR